MMLSRKGYRYCILALILSIIGACGWGLGRAIFQARNDDLGVWVEVTNAGRQAMLGCVVWVSNVQYGIGDLGPGEMGTIHAYSEGKAHFEIEFSDQSSNRRRLDAGGY